MIPYHHLTGMLYNRPLLILPEAGLVRSSYLLNRINAHGGDLNAIAIVEEANATHKPRERANAFVGEQRKNAAGGWQPFRSTAEGIAIIECIGDLVNRGAWIGSSCGMVSYEGLAHQITAAANDPLVAAIVLDFDSPGGEAIGCFELAAVVRDARTKKPVVSVVNGTCASAAYAAASQSSRIVMIPSGRSGSIGVFMLHMDISEYLLREGVKPTLIFDGDCKVDGNPFEALPDDVRERFQQEVAQLGTLFRETVAVGRSLTVEQVRATRALCFSGQTAVDAGLVDVLGTFSDAIAELSEPAFRASLTKGGASNSNKKLAARVPQQEEVMPKGSSDVTVLTRLGLFLSSLGNSSPNAEEIVPQPAPASAAEPCPTCGNEGCACGEKCTGKNCGCCDADPKLPAEEPSPSDETAKAGPVEGAEVVRLRAELARSNAAAAKLQEEANARELTAVADRASAVVAKVTAFTKTSGANMGAALRGGFEALYRGALSGTLTHGDQSATISAEAGAVLAAAIESLAATVHPAGAKERVAVGGDKVEIAARVAGGDKIDRHAAHFAALERLEARGVTPTSANFATEYNKEIGNAAA
jgi:signal peptide peptidase SppA